MLDYNGTLARDGELMAGVPDAIHSLSKSLRAHVLTGDHFGKAASALAGLPCGLSVLPAEGQAECKRDYVERLGVARTACVGNGRNDRLMLEAAALAIVVFQDEGAAGEALSVADVIRPSIHCAFELFWQPLRLVATLRS